VIAVVSFFLRKYINGFQASGDCRQGVEQAMAIDGSPLTILALRERRIEPRRSAGGDPWAVVVRGRT
jgi:hypothetical protein